MFTIGISFGVFAAIAAFAIGFEVMNILSFLLLFSLIHGALSVMLTITNNKMLKLIHTDFIASVCSVRTFYQRITAIITLAFLSATLTSHNLKAIFGLCGFVILFITLLLYLWSRNYNLYKLTEEKSCSQLS